MNNGFDTLLLLFVIAFLTIGGTWWNATLFKNASAVPVRGGNFAGGALSYQPLPVWTVLRLVKVYLFSMYLIVSFVPGHCDCYVCSHDENSANSAADRSADRRRRDDCAAKSGRWRHVHAQVWRAEQRAQHSAHMRSNQARCARCQVCQHTLLNMTRLKARL